MVEAKNPASSMEHRGRGEPVVQPATAEIGRISVAAMVFSENPQKQGKASTCGKQFGEEIRP